MVDHPDLVVAARGDGHRLEADGNGGERLQAVAADAEDLEAVVRRVGREEELAARRQRQRADLAALEEREASRLVAIDGAGLKAARWAAARTGSAAARHARTEKRAVRDEMDRRARYGIAMETSWRRHIRGTLGPQREGDPRRGVKGRRIV